MHPRDFSYWLMGYFELTGATSLTAKQAKEVAAHLALTMSTRPDSNRPHMACGKMFCQRLEGVFDAIDIENGLSEAQVTKIKTNLSTVFRDEIDPTFHNEEVLNAIHSGKPTPPAPKPRPTERC